MGTQADSGILVSKRCAIAAIVCNGIVALACVVCTVVLLTSYGSFMLRMFTTLSNIYAGVICALAIPSCVRALKTGVLQMPRWLVLLKQSSTVAVMVTFTVVFLFLGFIAGHLNMLTGTNLFFHLLSPLLALLTFAAFERGCTGVAWKKAWVAGLIPVALYGVVYFVMVVAIGYGNGGWYDFYYLNMGGMWPVSIVVMFAVVTLLSLLVWKLAGGQRK